MRSVEEIEKELLEAKKKELYNKWEIYLTNLKDKLELLKNKTILSWYQNGKFTIFKVKNVEEKHYIDREGFYGQWSPKRWLEIQTESYLVCSVADSSGRWYKPGISNVEPDKFVFKYISKKNKYKKDTELFLSKISFEDSSLNSSCYESMSKIYKVGFTEYEEYKEDPSYDRALDFLRMFTYIVPDEIFEKAEKIHNEHIKQTMEFWKLYEEKINNSIKVSELLK